MAYTPEHKRFLVESYFRSGRKVEGEWIYSVEECKEEFQAEFPHFPVVYAQFKSTLDRTVKLFRETGSILRKPGSGQTRKRTADVVANAQEIMTNAPKTSIRQLHYQINLSIGATHKLLHEDLGLYPYRVTAVQELLPVDYPQRIQFCNWFRDMNNNIGLVEKVIFSDEAWFHVSGNYNSQNTRIWSIENPHEIIQEPLHSQKIGAWAGLTQRRLIGPIFFQGTLTAERYRTEILQPFVDQLHDDELQDGYFQQDGATAHCTLETLRFLREYFDDRIISRNTDTPWPPRSCDLTPSDFFLWPYLKNNIFQTPVEDAEDLQERIIQKCGEINNNPEMLENVIRSMYRRVLKCIEMQGQHFQHLL